VEAIGASFSLQLTPPLASIERFEPLAQSLGTGVIGPILVANV